jgi:hypothetical protein
MSLSTPIRFGLTGGQTHDGQIVDRLLDHRRCTRSINSHWWVRQRMHQMSSSVLHLTHVP